MASVTSNLPAVASFLDHLADGFNFAMPGAAGASMGEEALDVIATSIADRTIGEQTSPGGEPLKELKDKTLTRKAKLGQPDLIGVATGTMISLVHLKGVKAITATEATMTYGGAGDAPAYAKYFSETRPFYGRDDKSDEAVIAYLRARLAAFIRGH